MLLTTRAPLAAFALIACFSVPLASQDAAKARRASRKLPKVETKLSGPTTVLPNESLEIQSFKATLTNRSAEPLVLFVRQSYLMNAHWNWTVTDAKNQPLGMAFVNRGYCGTSPYSEEAAAEARRIRDNDLTVLAPGESREFSIPGGPSDDYNFPEAGNYHLAVTLTYVVPNATFYTDAGGKRVKTRRSAGYFDTSGYEQWDLSQLSADSLDLLQRSLSFQAISTPWDLRLPTPRMHGDSDAVLSFQVPPR